MDNRPEPADRLARVSGRKARGERGLYEAGPNGPSNMVRINFGQHLIFEGLILVVVGFCYFQEGLLASVSFGKIVARISELSRPLFILSEYLPKFIFGSENRIANLFYFMR
jgi:hypothetical protein